MATDPRKITSYSEFWPFYLAEHSQRRTKFWHALGTLIGLAFVVACLVLQHPALIPLALVPGYGFAWYSHFFVEKNRPATFIHPFWSFISDFRMLYLFLLGKF